VSTDALIREALDKILADALDLPVVAEPLVVAFLPSSF
jgi:hypothetical protein